MSDESHAERAQPVDPSKPLGAGVGPADATPVSTSESPVVTVPAANYAAAESLMDVMEGKLATMQADAIADISVTLEKFRQEKARDFASLRKLLGMNGGK